jgi:glycosyltransferase involved in cell wall biosynthesis
MKEPIRILELRSVRGTGGGPEKTILSGAKRSDPRRFAVTVCYIRDLRDDMFQMDRRAGGLGVDYVEIQERHSYDPSVWSALRRLVRERHIRIVHGHDYKTNLLAWLLARAEGTAPLSTVHGWFGRGTWRERVYYAADKRMLARFPRLIAVSSALKTELVRTGSRPEAVSVVPNGIDHHTFARSPGLRERARQALGLADGDIVVGSLGRLERQKRFDLLMDAVSHLRARDQKFRLLIAGDGGLRDHLDAVRSRLGLGDACRLLGHRADVPALLSAFDVFVQASDQEGSPNVLLEAMALQTPIVATDVGGTTEMVADGVEGFVVPPGDARALATAIERVCGDPVSAQSRAAAGRRRVERDLSFDARMARVESIYEGLAWGA